MKRLLNMLRGVASCSEILEVIQAYIDGEIDAETARRVAGHLDRCDGCNGEKEIYEQIKSSLGRRRRDVDMDVLEQLMSFGERLKSDPTLGQ